ncbi:hypothetical protein SAMN04488518_1353 [Pseudovibrio ascidiaceicola]|uniref:Transposase n=1 Tax=Pseudovibrio ascidiaceicola TaxID=285279 RepID=A0A1I4G8V3_9HYPH|nr:hypothetical protein [Pseudovibrio ascidiaceicola]SFL26475.1 hypothetical protein SAMN04488518_1353 [Pseudovibrio ascidiaceicola]
MSFWKLARNGLSEIQPAKPAQGKIECWHKIMKNSILIENYYKSVDLEDQIGKFITYGNHHHESLDNVTPTDVYFRRDKQIQEPQENIKRHEIHKRCLHYHAQAA